MRLGIPSHAQNMHVGHFSEEVIFRALAIMMLGTFGKGIFKKLIMPPLEVTYFLFSYVLIIQNLCFQDV